MTTVEVTPRSPRPPIRLRPAPQCEPPFDDERDPEAWASAHQLALVWPAGAEPEEPEEPARPKGAAARARRRGAAKTAGRRPDPRSDQAPEPCQASAGASPGPATVGGPLGPPAETATSTRTPGATRAPATGAGPFPGGGSPPVETADGAGVPTRASRDAKLAVRRFVGACVEVLNGYRPAAHLRRLALPAEAARVVAQAIAGAHRVAELRRGDPRRPAHRSRARPAPVAVIHLWLCEPRPGAVEASVVLVTGDRTWALALRLELHHESWLATTLRLI